MLGTNAGLIGAARTSRRGAAVGLWTPNEQVIYQRQNAWIGDANYDSVSLLLHMDGSNGSTTFTDSSKNALAVTANGNAQISTAQSKFGGASALFDGAGDYLAISNNAALATTGDFTIELWIRPASTSLAFIFTQSAPSGGLLLYLGASGQIGVQSGSSAYKETSSSIYTSGAWQHVALVKTATNTYKVYYNGNEQVFVSSAGTLGSTLPQLDVRLGVDFTNSGYFNGYIDDFRITKGVARYTANFTPPSAPFPDL